MRCPVSQRDDHDMSCQTFWHAWSIRELEIPGHKWHEGRQNTVDKDILEKISY